MCYAFFYSWKGKQPMEFVPITENPPLELEESMNLNERKLVMVAHMVNEEAGQLRAILKDCDGEVPQNLRGLNDFVTKLCHVLILKQIDIID